MTSALTTFDQLSTLVHLDKKEHKFKFIAQLFLSAATDWPTPNQNEILEFVKELNEYFGIPLTKDKVTKKMLNTSADDAWRNEAASSIIELLDVSEGSLTQSDLDKTLQELLAFYQQQLNAIDFIADLKYLPIEEGGRKVPAVSGYRPAIKFDFAEMQTSGEQTFLNKEIVFPGDTVEAAIKIISVEYFSNCLTEGMKFDFREGPTIIGTGKITSILNLQLKQASR